MSEGRRSTTAGAGQLERGAAAPRRSDAARKRAAVEMIAGHEAALKRTARRYSLDAEDAEDAYQRALEIALTKAPTTDPRELIRWTQTVTKHEALALREGRERLLGHRAARGPGDLTDPVALIPAPADGPGEQAERREEVARSREALRALKPAELRALTLLAEGYSYAEIGELTGFSQTKVNRVLVEGRNRFRSLLSRSEDGRRCRELRPLLSALCDGEAKADEAATVREHLRACARCRSTMRAYRAAPRTAAALAPLLPPSRSLLERAHDLLGGLGSRLPGVGSGNPAAAQVATAAGPPGAGMVGLAKLLAVCAGAGGAACVATGVLPTPLEPTPQPPEKPAIERAAERQPEVPVTVVAEEEPSPEPASPGEPKHEKPAQPGPADAGGEASASPAGAAEYETAPADETPPAPPPSPPPAPAASGESASAPAPSGSPAGEFGP